ncbi:hypothetical protein J7T55_015285 [Diaporthe amygdali]|uniref:uncharacterized protein n=1 Tax=Phomopsis amygdali TaxID=1214568 RepID=UPI0022FF06B9|nr:uncharacterized protein J7T55_015285 [Diaporthe amygdali]KAJ0120556.1 hypothetical protein J7T55_015285 [Diaporthe amygdali]
MEMHKAIYAADDKRVVCECGVELREPAMHLCPVSKVIVHLRDQLHGFRAFLGILDFAKDGPLVYGLRSETEKLHQGFIESFYRVRNDSEQHPEWCLDEYISRMRMDFDATAQGYVNDGEEDWRTEPPRSVVPHNVFTNNTTLGNAKHEIYFFYELCLEMISNWSGYHHCGYDWEADGCQYLSSVDKYFQDTFGKITLLPRAENAAMRDLVEKTFEIWKETRRLLSQASLIKLIIPSPSA